MLTLRRKATMMALGAIIVSSVAVATPAHAASLGTAQTAQKYTYEGSKNWGAGYDACKAKNGATRSVKWVGAGGGTKLTTSDWYGLFECFDTNVAP